MKLKPAAAKLLLRLEGGEAVPLSAFGGHWDLVDDMLRRGVAFPARSGAGQVLRADPALLQTYYRRQCNVPDLAAVAALQGREGRTRSGVLAATGDTKQLATRPMAGIHVRIVGHGAPEGIDLPPTAPGVALFLSETLLPRLRLPDGVPLVTVENSENFLWADARAQCPEIPPHHVLCLRDQGWNERWREWLRATDPEIVHLGDYDPDGVRIYLSQVARHVTRSRFGAPPNIEELVRNGSRELYTRQRRLDADTEQMDASAVEILNIINRHEKALEQEHFSTTVQSDCRCP